MTSLNRWAILAIRHNHWRTGIRSCGGLDER